MTSISTDMNTPMSDEMAPLMRERRSRRKRSMRWSLKRALENMLRSGMLFRIGLVLLLVVGFTYVSIVNNVFGPKDEALYSTAPRLSVLSTEQLSVFNTGKAELTSFYRDPLEEEQEELIMADTQTDVPTRPLANSWFTGDLRSLSFLPVQPAKQGEAVAGDSNAVPGSPAVVAVNTSAALASSETAHISSPVESKNLNAALMGANAEPVASNAALVNSNVAPVSANVEPVASNAALVNSNVAPVSTNVEPVATTVESISATADAASLPAKPMGLTVTSVSSNAEPVSLKVASIGSSVGPLVSNVVPASLSAKPVSPNVQPVRVSAAPAMRSIKNTATYEVNDGGSLWRTGKRFIDNDALLYKFIGSLEQSGMNVRTVRAGAKFIVSDLGRDGMVVIVNDRGATFESRIVNGSVATSVLSLN